VSATSPPPRPRDEAHTSRVSVLGRSLVTGLAVFWKTSRLYNPKNIAYQQSLSHLMDALHATFELEKDFALHAIGDSLYLNEVRLKVDMVGQSTYMHLVDEFARRGIGGLRFAPGITESEVIHFSERFHAWKAGPGEELAPLSDFEDELNQLGITGIWPVRELTMEKESDREPPTDEGQSQRIQARKSFVRAMQATKLVMLSAKQGKRIDLRNAKRAVQSIVDLILSEELSLLGMTALKDYDEYTYQHCVNVAILSISMGTRLGLSKQQLSQIGVAGLFHDIGKVRIPNNILQKPGKLSPEEWAVMKTHPVEGVKLITKLHGVSNLAIRAMITAYEHHLNIDLTGYPRVKRPRDQNLFSRVIAITDCFDAMTAHRSYQKDPFTPYEALHYMTTKLEDRFDTTLLKVFVRTVGIFPPGTVVRLNTGELALVLSPSPNDVWSPTVQLLRDAEGETCPPERISLEHEPPRVGRRVVADALRPELVGIQAEELMIR
jgi:putative nucleotidyltransferase with HDIG domain